MDALLCFPLDLPAAQALTRIGYAGLPTPQCRVRIQAEDGSECAPGQVGELLLRDDLFDDFCVLPARPDELTARLQHLFWRNGQSMRPDLIEYGPLMLNLETYQAAVAGRVLDLTYMEYELLRFLAGHPAKVFTRETLLSRVWGYEYYGGARTVDVHIRRLRAKLGEEHAHLIQTVRSVGYRFGQVAWHPGLNQRTGT